MKGVERKDYTMRDEYQVTKTWKYENIFWALLISGGLFVCIYLTVPVWFETNDDTSIMNVLAGYRTGEPYPYHQFINVLLGYLVTFLYKVFPLVSWWTLLHVIFLFVSMVVIFWTSSTILKERKFKRAYIFFYQLFIALFCFALPIQTMQFTVTSAVLGTAVIFTELLDDKKLGESKILWIFRLSGILFCFLMRRSSANVIIVLYFITFVYRYLKNGKNESNSFYLRKKILWITITGILLLAAQFINVGVTNKIESSEFKALNSARVHYMDRPTITYEEDPGLYNEIGWDETFYQLTRGWYFLDERWNVLNVETIVSASEAQKSKVHIKEQIKVVFERYYSFLMENKVGRMYFITVISFTVLSVVLFFSKKSQVKMDWIYVFLLGAVFCLLTVYLAFVGRIIRRAYQVAAIPVVIMQSFLILQGIGIKLPKRGYLKILALLLAIGVCIPMLGEVYSESRRTVYEDQSNQANLCIDYARNNLDKILVYDTGTINNKMAWKVYQDRFPINLKSWGGSTYKSDLWNKQVAASGIEKLSAETLLEPNVYYMSADGGFRELFICYMMDKFENIDYEIVDRVNENVIITKFYIK